MALELTNKENVNAPDSDFPFGDVRDKTPSVAGTKWNRQMMSDYIQFFHKMMSEAGITYNNQLDNEYSGWQFYEAFRKLTKPYKAYHAKVTQSGTADPTAEVFVNELSGTPVWQRDSTGVFFMELTGEFSGNVNIQLSEPTNINTVRRALNNDDTVSILNYDYNSMSTPPYDLTDDMVVFITVFIYD